ncbi:MAG: hypothetical protein Q9165_002489 [Trypethelium subeluteriae]
MTLHHVALIGATSRIGPTILNAHAQASPPLSTTILIRATSELVPSYANSHLSTIPDLPTHADLKTALEGHDTLVCALHPSTLEHQLRLADACVASGVRRYILADYGSVESDGLAVAELIGLFRNKTIVREYCQRLTEVNGGSVGRAARRVLKNEEETKGKLLYVQIFRVSQIDIPEVYLANSGGKTLEKIDIGTDEYNEEMKKETRADS